MTWVSFLKKKGESLKKFRAFKELDENETDLRIKFLRLDNGGEFTSNDFGIFFEDHGINRKFLVARTPQQNGIVERKNRTIQEMARTMLKGAKLSDIFSREVVHTTIHILNKELLRTNNNKTPYEIWRGMPPSEKYFKILGSKCYIKRNEDNLGKFDSRINEGSFLGYSLDSKSYKS